MPTFQLQSGYIDEEMNSFDTQSFMEK